jgi:hypothetical protein
MIAPAFLLACLFSSGLPGGAEDGEHSLFATLEELEGDPVNPNLADRGRIESIPLLMDLDVDLLIRGRMERPFRNFADLRRRLRLPLPLARLLKPVFTFREPPEGPSLDLTLLFDRSDRDREKVRIEGEIPALGTRGRICTERFEDGIETRGGILYESRSGEFELGLGSYRAQMALGLVLCERTRFTRWKQVPASSARVSLTTGHSGEVGIFSRRRIGGLVLTSAFRLPDPGEEWMRWYGRAALGGIGLNVGLDPSGGRPNAMSCDLRVEGSGTGLRSEAALGYGGRAFRALLSSKSERLRGQIAVQVARGFHLGPKDVRDGTIVEVKLGLKLTSSIGIEAVHEISVGPGSDRINRERGQSSCAVSFRPHRRVEITMEARGRRPGWFGLEEEGFHAKTTRRFEVLLRPLRGVELRGFSENRSFLGRSGDLSYLQCGCGDVRIRFTIYDCRDYRTRISTHEPDLPLASGFLRLQGAGRRISLCLRRELEGIDLRLKGAISGGRLSFRAALSLRA